MKNAVLSLLLLIPGLTWASEPLLQRCFVTTSASETHEWIDSCLLGQLDITEGSKPRGKAFVHSCQLFAKKEPVAVVKIEDLGAPSQLRLVAAGGLDQNFKTGETLFSAEVVQLGNSMVVRCVPITGTAPTLKIKKN